MQITDQCCTDKKESDFSTPSESFLVTTYALNSRDLRVQQKQPMYASITNYAFDLCLGVLPICANAL